MKLQQWGIYDYPFPAPIGKHPAVIISPQEICDNPSFENVNALPVTSIKQGNSLHKTQVGINGSDGLDHYSGVKCSAIHLLPKKLFEEQRGLVTDVPPIIESVIVRRLRS